MAGPSPRGALTPADLENLPPAQRERLLERNPDLRDALDNPPAPARPRRARESAPVAPKSPASDTSATPAPTRTRAPKAAKRGATDRAATRGRGASRRGVSSGRRLASRAARQTPGVPGPSVTNLVLSFAGSTVLVIGLVLLIDGGNRLQRLPTWLGSAASKLTNPADPIF